MGIRPHVRDWYELRASSGFGDLKIASAPVPVVERLPSENRQATREVVAIAISQRTLMPELSGMHTRREMLQSPPVRFPAPLWRFEWRPCDQHTPKSPPRRCRQQRRSRTCGCDNYNWSLPTPSTKGALSHSHRAFRLILCSGIVWNRVSLTLRCSRRTIAVRHKITPGGSLRELCDSVG